MPDRRRHPSAYAVLAALVLAGCGSVPSADPVSSSPPGSAATSTATPSATRSASPSASASRSPSSPPSTGGPSATSSTSAKGVDVYAQHVTLTDATLRWDQLRWYTGKAARARCAKLGKQGMGALCYEYFYEKTSRKGTGGITGTTVVRLLDDDGHLRSSSSAQLGAAIRSDDWPYYRIWRSGDTITRIEQVFTP